MLNHSKQKGFTLVELMISMLVFSVVMLISTYTFIQINRYYTKGITLVRMQDSVRNVMADISNQIQLTTGNYSKTVTSPSPEEGYYCIGNKRYTYKINSQENNTTNHALTSQTVNPTNCTLTSDPARTLLPSGSKLLVFDVISGTSSLYDINIAMINGADDLIDKSAGSTALWRCKTDKGSQFCASTNLATSVFKRVQ
jgi:prepilin-type N-terminal cleavage/methylation domain-containing protein